MSKTTMSARPITDRMRMYLRHDTALGGLPALVPLLEDVHGVPLLAKEDNAWDASMAVAKSV